MNEQIAVLMGGQSAEREISLRSGTTILNALQKQGLNAVAVDVGCDVVQQLQQSIDIAFIALHGPEGEDGKIQALLEHLDIPYTGSGIAASALSMDKYRCKLIWQALGLKTPKFALVTDNNLQQVADSIGYPVAVKPINEGSSFGVHKVESAATLAAAFTDAARYGAVMMEQWQGGKEYAVSIVGEHILPSICIETPRAFYDYDAKYVVNTTQYHCPSGLDILQEQQIQGLAKQAYDAIGCTGWGRVDFITDRQGDFQLIELNTIPGMTETSLVPKAAKDYGWSFEQLVNTILDSAR